MWKHLCCRRRSVTPISSTTVLVAPAAPPPAPDLVVGLPDNNRDSSAVSRQEDNDKKELISRKFSDVTPEHLTEEASFEEENFEDKPPSAPRSPSIRVEDFSNRKDIFGDNPNELHKDVAHEEMDRSADNTSGSQVSLQSERASAGSSPATRTSTPRRSPAPSRASNSLPVSRAPTRSPSPISPSKSTSKIVEASPRDVRAALATCMMPPRQQEDWEAIVRGLREAERLAADSNARAPAASWRAVARSTASHVRSLRSRVARAACTTIGALFETRGRVLEPETEEAAGALLDRTADVNRFLRGDAEEALVRLACGVTAARAATALVRKGATHRAGPVRAAAAAALAEFVVRKGAGCVLDLPPEPRTLLLRAAVDLLGDASPDARNNARRLCIALAEDARFRPLLKESLPANKYRNVEKSVDRLRCR